MDKGPFADVRAGSQTMADRLAVPEDPDALFLSSGDDVNPNRPLHTGDVIEGVVLPVLDDEPTIVVIVSHPCAMRAGPKLQPLLHVAPVVSHSESGPQMWTGNFKLMALDGLAVLTNPVVRLDRSTLVQSVNLGADRRIACLDRPGVNILRQRLVHHLTRVVIDVSIFDQEAAPAHEEVDLMEDWLDAATAHGLSLEEGAAAFHEWIRTDGRQGRLEDPASVSSVRRVMRSELRQLYASP